jgi:hypothetical protein
MQARTGDSTGRWASRVLVAALGLAACVPVGQQTIASDPGPQHPAIETVAFQEILSPVPVRLRLPARLGVEQVVLYYRTFGERTWNALRLMRSGQTWYGSIGCLEVSTITGYLQFFLQGQDPKGRVIIATGMPSQPHLVQIAARLESGPTALPGDPPTWRCVDPADCPPGFAGCPSYVPRRPPCATNADCRAGDYCAWDGYCDSITPVFQVPIAAHTPVR